MLPNDSRPKVEVPLNLEPEPKSSQGFWLELAGGLILIGGLATIGLYQWLTEPALLSQGPWPGQSLAPATPRSAASPTSPPSPPPPAKNNHASDLYQTMPKSGTYYAEDASLGTSRRELASHNGRFCIKLVNVRPGENSSSPQIIVSSLSTRKDGIYLDATQEKLTLDSTTTQIRDRWGTWQWLQSKVDRDGPMADCLAQTQPYPPSK